LDYLKTYYNLVKSRQKLVRDCYLEKHHIIPRSIYGKGYMNDTHLKNVEDKSNIVKLTGREHFIAHWLLHRQFTGVRPFAAAFHAMASMSNKHHFRYTPSSRAIEEARKDYAELLKKSIAMYSLEGELIRVFESTEDAAIEFEVSVNNLSAACNEENNVNNIKGYQWRRFNKFPKKKIEPYINSNNESKQILHEYDLEGNYIKSYESIREASRNGIERSIFKKENRNKPIFFKDKWYSFESKDFQNKLKVKKSNTQRRRVHQIDPKSGEILKTWNSSREPQRVLGISNVSAVCNGKRKTMGGFIWKYAEEDYNLDLRKHKRKLPRANEITIYKNNILIGQFDSLRKAEEKTGIKRALLSKLLKSGNTKNDIKVIKTTPQHRV
jgi:hypothetical protein